MNCAHVGLWHEAADLECPRFGRYGVESGLHWLVMSISAYDPNRTINRKGVESPTHPSGTPALRMPSMMRSRWAR